MARTALQIVRAAATKLGIDQPDVLFTATDRTEIELRQALIEASDKILHMHDWQALRTVVTHDGDGSTTQFALPSDYIRMPKDARVWSTKWQLTLHHITPEEWLNLDVREFELARGTWTIYGGNFVYKPALDADEDAKFWYISRNVVLGSDQVAKEEFSADDDTYKLDDRVLELVLVWVWRQQKGLDYAEEMQTAEYAVSRAMARDGGARILTQSSRSGYNAETAYPIRVEP